MSVYLSGPLLVDLLGASSSHPGSCCLVLLSVCVRAGLRPVLFNHTCVCVCVPVWDLSCCLRESILITSKLLLSYSFWFFVSAGIRRASLKPHVCLCLCSCLGFLFLSDLTSCHHIQTLASLSLRSALAITYDTNMSYTLMMTNN